jgi:hypothetical protein
MRRGAVQRPCPATTSTQARRYVRRSRLAAGLEWYRLDWWQCHIELVLVEVSTPNMTPWAFVIVDAFSERQTLNKNRGGALCTGADGPRAGVGRSAAWCEARWCSLREGGLSAAWGRTVRGLVRG